MNVNRYQFDSIVSKTKKTISPIMRGEEDGVYFEYLAQLETRLYGFHKQYGINGRQAKEILQVLLFDIKNVTEQAEYDCSKLEEDCYRACADEIELLFFPEKNPALKAALKEPVTEDDAFFEFARKIIVRIHESVELWTRENGSDGYFNFIGGYIGSEILANNKFLIEGKYLK